MIDYGKLSQRELEAHRRLRRRAYTPFHPLVERQAPPSTPSPAVLPENVDLDPCDNEPDTVAIIVLVVSLVVVLGLVIGGCWYWRRSRRRALARQQAWRIHLPGWLKPFDGRKAASETSTEKPPMTAMTTGWNGEQWTPQPLPPGSAQPFFGPVPPPLSSSQHGMMPAPPTAWPPPYSSASAWHPNGQPASHWDGSMAYVQQTPALEPPAVARRPSRRERRRLEYSSSEDSEDDRPRRKRPARRRGGGGEVDLDRAKAAALANARKGMADVRRGRDKGNREEEDDEYGFDIEPDIGWDRRRGEAARPNRRVQSRWEKR